MCQGDGQKRAQISEVKHTFEQRYHNKLKAQNKIYNADLHKNIITKAIGTHPKIEPSIGKTSFDKGDVFLMCTDGLTDYILDDDIKKIIYTGSTCRNICTDLIKKAKNNGSSDNITAIAIKILEI